MRLLFTMLINSLLCSAGHAQNAYWDTYMARYDKGVGSVMLNMELIKSAPNRNLPFLVITGVDVKNCAGDGFPKKDEFGRLYQISDAVNKIIFSSTQAELAGTFTFQCQRLDYLYVRDTSGLRDKITHLYNKSYKTYSYHLEVRTDKEWLAYSEFLYPNEETRLFMQDSRVVDQLKEAGDKLDQPRVIEHWLYFESEEGRETFIGFVTGMKFKIESKKSLKESKRPYQLQIARPDKADLESITQITKALTEKAKEYGGEYDGWESPVVKK